MLPAVRALMAPSAQGVIRAKAALQLAKVIPERTVRAPLLDATDDEVARLREALGTVA
jgi:4-hydroxy-tetrahydrodipicolinate synthase